MKNNIKYYSTLVGVSGIVLLSVYVVYCFYSSVTLLSDQELVRIGQIGDSFGEEENED